MKPIFFSTNIWEGWNQQVDSRFKHFKPVFQVLFFFRCVWKWVPAPNGNFDTENDDERVDFWAPFLDDKPIHSTLVNWDHQRRMENMVTSMKLPSRQRKMGISTCRSTSEALAWFVNHKSLNPSLFCWFMLVLLCLESCSLSIGG